MTKDQPIGIFDSGLGGLTVARAVRDVLPKEQLVYFGDSAHLPYGDKSAATIQAYSVKICDVLLKHDCKVVLIACNSASAAAFDLVKAYMGSKALVMNVIDPVVDHLDAHFIDKKVGLIGTKQTVGSGIYRKKIESLNRQIRFSALATPLLAPMIEEGFHTNDISTQIIAEYLSNASLEDLDALVLGCTHYPLIKDSIDSFYHSKTEVIDSSEIVARALKTLLVEKGLLASKKQSNDRFLVSDLTPAFQAATALFFGQDLTLEKHVLWE